MGIIVGLLGVRMTWISGIGPGLLGTTLCLPVLVYISWALRDRSPVICSLFVYVSLFFGLFIGDIILAYRLDGFQSIITGGLLLSDGLIWVPSAFALIFRFLHPSIPRWWNRIAEILRELV